MRSVLILSTVVLLSFSNTHIIAQVEVVNAYPNLSFNAPIDYQFASQSDNQVYVAERNGRILVF